MDQRIFLGLGSNIGDGSKPLYAAVEHLRTYGIDMIQASSIYRTPPWGKTDQSDFYNMVVEVRFEGMPDELLAIAMQVEQALGRVRTVQWGPRTIDIDVLAFGDEIVASQRLTIPHPMLAERAFVLVPWSEIAPDFQVPAQFHTVAELLSQLSSSEIEGIIRMEQ